MSQSSKVSLLNVTSLNRNLVAPSANTCRIQASKLSHLHPNRTLFIGHICIVRRSILKKFLTVNYMRKIIVLSFITLDGVMQAPGGPEEDASGNFKYGGWVAPYGDEVSGKVMEKLMKPADLLLGRKTSKIWEEY